MILMDWPSTLEKIVSMELAKDDFSIKFSALTEENTIHRKLQIDTENDNDNDSSNSDNSDAKQIQNINKKQRKMCNKRK